MIVSLDYDGTYTRDPQVWDQIIEVLRLQGHEVYVVTMRYEATQGQEVYEALSGKVDKIIFTERKAKKTFLRNLGILIDVWIDDIPYFILADAS